MRGLKANELGEEASDHADEGVGDGSGHHGDAADGGRIGQGCGCIQRNGLKDAQDKEEASDGGRGYELADLGQDAGQEQDTDDQHHGRRTRRHEERQRWRR